MTIPVEQLSFIPTRGTHKRSLADWSSDQVLNVQNFGALGDYSHDDTANIQACFDAAFGSYASPHGMANAYQNRSVYFPPGRYRSSTLNIRNVHGGHIFGPGSSTAQIVMYGAAPPAPAAPTVMLNINGAVGLSVVGISFIGYGPDPTGSSVTAINLDWDGVTTDGGGLRDNYFERMGAANCIYGFIIGASGHGGSGNLFVLVGGDNNMWGCKIISPEAYDNTFIGGGLTNSVGTVSGAIWCLGGSINVINTGPTGNQPDYLLQSPNANHMIQAGRSESKYVCRITQGTVTLRNVFQNSGTPPGHFLSVESPAVAIMDTCNIGNLAYDIIGNGTLFLKGANSWVASFDPLASFAGTIREYQRVSPFTWATRPAQPAEGLTIDVVDANLTGKVWGDPITAGSSTGHALLRWNGSAWTLVGK